jgi:hypothetical protein
MFEPNGPSFASQTRTGDEITEFIECKASTMIPRMSTLTEIGQKVSESSSNEDAAVCEHEQPPSDDEEIQDEARRVGLLLKENDGLWTEQGWSSARKSSGLSRKTPPAREAQTTSTSRR